MRYFTAINATRTGSPSLQRKRKRTAQIKSVTESRTKKRRGSEVSCQDSTPMTMSHSGSAHEIVESSYNQVQQILETISEIDTTNIPLEDAQALKTWANDGTVLLQKFYRHEQETTISCDSRANVMPSEAASEFRRDSWSPKHGHGDTPTPAVNDEQKGKKLKSGGSRLHIYRMDRKNVTSIHDLWVEYSMGLPKVTGTQNPADTRNWEGDRWPSIKFLEATYGAAWRSGDGDRQFFHRRQYIWKRVEDMTTFKLAKLQQLGVVTSEEATFLDGEIHRAVEWEAVEWLGNEWKGETLHHLFKIFRQTPEEDTNLRNEAAQQISWHEKDVLTAVRRARSSARLRENNTSQSSGHNSPTSATCGLHVLAEAVVNSLAVEFSSDLRFSASNAQGKLCMPSSNSARRVDNGKHRAQRV
ncbi:hypothetical protein BDZ91DRAFT_1496 [Kalaharituber pfeilii]|nr:hypothetical protein BDZ91DRAFT_1496 [Kalaharituber pfeilii]